MSEAAEPAVAEGKAVEVLSNHLIRAALFVLSQIDWARSAAHTQSQIDSGITPPTKDALLGIRLFRAAAAFIAEIAAIDAEATPEAPDA